MNDPRLFLLCYMLHEDISGTKAYNKRELGKLLKRILKLGLRTRNIYGVRE